MTKKNILNKKEVNFFKKEGFLYIKNFLSKKLINELNKSIIFSLDVFLKKKNCTMHLSNLNLMKS